MRPVLMLFVGTRGTRIADMCDPLAEYADVVIATSDDVLAQRADTLDDTVRATDLVRAPDLDSLAVACRRYPGRVDGALSFSDDMIELVARFAAERGLPGQPPETTAAFRDKFLQRSLLAAGGLPVPRHIEITDPEQAEKAVEVVGLPAFLKPTRGSGSALAYRVDSVEELRERLEAAFAAAPRVGGAVAGDTAFILEGLLVGHRWHEVDGFAPYVSVESVAVAGRYEHLAVTDRFPQAPPVLETGMMLPSSLDDAQRGQAVEIADRALRALDFRHGLAHVELMLTADGPRVIEVNARSGGAIPYLFPLAGGPDLVALAGRAALGELPTMLPSFDGHAVFVAPQHPVGVRVAKVTGLDRAAAVPGVQVVIPLSVNPTSTDDFQGTMIAAVLGRVATPEQAVTLWRDVMASVRAEYLP